MELLVGIYQVMTMLSRNHLFKPIFSKLSQAQYNEMSVVKSDSYLVEWLVTAKSMLDCLASSPDFAYDFGFLLLHISGAGEGSDN